MTAKIGFCCKWIDSPDQTDGIKPKDDCKQYNTGTTTVAWLNRQNQSTAEEKLWDLMKGNIESVRKLVKRVGDLPNELRMVRISSDILPVYTEPKWKYFWALSDVRAYAEKHFAVVGDLARSRNVRLSMHPGQYVCLASDNPIIVNKSIEEFEYHADMARWMGYGQSFQDFKINVHISGKQGPQGIINVLPRLSTEARNCITIENDEMTWGLDSSIKLADHCALVVDIHHHWVNTGEYLSPSDPRLQRVIDSWRGVRPVMHYSVSREDCLVDHCNNTLPNMQQLLASGYKKQKLRAHSNFFWNTVANQWALSFNDTFDIMCESKGKNLASIKLFESKGTV
jgi:UV DNA damage endonuclease